MFIDKNFKSGDGPQETVDFVEKTMNKKIKYS